jgi:ABC-type sugar transport system ATPase subunit
MTMSGRIAVLNTGKLEQYDTPRTVYDMPSTVFAARFIGSPAMNFINGTVSTQEGTVGIDTSAGFLFLDKERSERARTMIGRDVMAGIRPHHISFVDHLASRRFSDSQITVDVELIEAMGDRSLVVGRTGGNLVVRFLATRDDDFNVDQTYPVVVDGRKVHLFDPESKRNVFS